MKRIIIPLCCGAAALGAACAPASSPASAPDAAAGTAAYRSVVPPSAETEVGLFAVHRVGDRLLFEIPDSLLGRDMAVLSRLARAQTDLALGGDRIGPNLMVRWERRGDRILLRAPSHEARADAGSSLYLAVENSHFAPILAALEIEAHGDRTSVVDVTDLYLGEGSAFGFDRSRRERHRVRGFDRDRSFLNSARAFPINVEVLATRTYTADAPPSETRGGRSRTRSTIR